MAHKVTLVLIPWVLASACSTSYSPRRTPQARIIIKDGSPAVERDGRLHELGPFLGGAGVIFEPGTRAFEFGEAAQRASDVGTGLYFGGLATVIAGPVVAASALSQDSDENRFSLVFGTALVGLAVSLVGMSFIQQANLSLLDAVNVHNDDTWEMHANAAKNDAQQPPAEPAATDP